MTQLQQKLKENEMKFSLLIGETNRINEILSNQTNEMAQNKQKQEQ